MGFKDLSVIFVIILIHSCAVTDQASNIPDELPQDLVQKFELDKEVVEQFKTQSPPHEDSLKAPVKLEEKVEEEKVEKEEKEEKVKKEEKEEEKPTQEIIHLDKIKYPKNYPQKFKDYDGKFNSLWKNYTPNVYIGEKYTFEISYLGVTAGHAILQTQETKVVGGENSFHFSGRLLSASYYSYIYKLDDTIHSYVGLKDFLPVKYVLTQRESKQNVDDLQLFDQNKLTTFFLYKKDKEGQITNKKRSDYIPHYIQDSFSALHFARGLPLKKGDVYEYPVVTRSKLWILKIKVIGQENILVNGKSEDALKISAQTRFPGVLKKRGDILFWFSNDEQKRFLKFKAKVKIGSIAGNLVKYRPGKKYTPPAP